MLSERLEETRSAHYTGGFNLHHLSIPSKHLQSGHGRPASERHSEGVSLADR